MSLAPLERLDPYGGTYDIVWTLSNVPDTFGEAGALWGTFDIVWTLSNVSDTFGEAGALWGTFDIVWKLSNVPGTFGEAGALWGTFDIVRSLSNVPYDWGQLIKTGQSLSFVLEFLGEAGPYGGTFDIGWSLSNVSDSQGNDCWTPIRGHLIYHLSLSHCGQLIMTSQYQMSSRHLSGTIDIGWSLSNVLGQYHLSLGHYQMSLFSC